MKPAYYNEFDPYAAEWLKNLISAGHIAPGDVDNRSIEDVKPDDLRPYGQCHFFAGIGVWSYALRLAGWDDSRSVWTGSCPCQPFSAAGAGNGFDDERHLWPAWLQLIAQCRPGEIFGEQVEAAIRFGWLDLVQTDLEGLGYAFGAFGLPAAGVGAPHIRARLWFLAHALPAGRAERRAGAGGGPIAGMHGFGELGDAELVGPQGGGDAGIGQNVGEAGSKFAGAIADSRVGDADNERLEGGERPESHIAEAGAGRARPYRAARQFGPCDDGAGGSSDPVDRMWDAVDWLLCRDGKWRGVEPGTFPLANGAPARVGRLRAYGNAIVPQVAAEFIRAYMECRP